jgi:hypothetical protein
MAGLGVRSRTSGAGRGARIAALLLLSALVLAGGSEQASAATSRPLLKSIDLPDTKGPMGLTTDSAGNIYVNMRVHNTAGVYGMVEKFDSAGNPVNFTGSAPYIEGNKILGRPNPDYQGNPEEQEFFRPEFDSYFQNGIAVDDSGGSNDGYIYTTPTYNDGFGVAWAFKPNGEYAGLFNQGFGFFSPSCALSIKQTDGSIYVGTSENVVRRYEPETTFNAGAPNGSATTNSSNCAMAVDGAGNLYSESNGAGVFKYPAANFGSSPVAPTEIFSGSVASVAFDQASGHLFVDTGPDVREITTAGAPVGGPFGGLDQSRGVSAAPGNKVLASNLGFPGGSIDVFGPPANLPIDTTDQPTEVLQTEATLNGSVDPDGSGPVTGCEFQWGTDSRYLGTPIACEQLLPIVAPTSAGAHLTGLTQTTTYHYRLKTTSATGVQTGQDRVFTTPDAVIGVTTGDATSVTKDSAVLNGSYTGQGLDTTYYFEYGTNGEFNLKQPAVPAHTGVESGPQQIDPITIENLKGSTEYQYRLVMTNSIGTVKGGERTFTTPPAVDNVETGDATEVGPDSAVLHGSYTADSYEVHYYFEWGATTAYGNKTPAPPGTAIAPGSGTVEVTPVKIEGLQEGGIYHYRLVVTNSAGSTAGQDRSFKTAEPPQISNLGSKNVTATSGDLTAEVNPNRGDTEWFFEWGPTTDYGSKTPVPPGKIAAGSTSVPVEVHLEGLNVGQTYHFRLTASNQFGSRTTGDQSVGFYPPSCPNSQVRQETGAAHTPDCRGYEIVTPGNAHGTTIFPQNAPPSSGYASTPPRLTFSAGFGEFDDAGKPLLNIADMYVATRGSEGWTSRYTGMNAHETNFMAGPPHGGIQGPTNYGPSNSFFETVTDLSMGRVVNYDLGYPQFYKQIQPGYNTPLVWDSDTGELIDRWPTGVEQVPGGKEFVGWQAFSADLNHFVFSSNVAFVDGVESFANAITCCTYPQYEFEPGKCCPAPIYDNNTVTGEFNLVSLREDDTVFRGIPIKVSETGTHIVMSETGDATLGYARPFYIRFGGHSYDIGDGAPVKFVDMTRDGSTAYFTSSAQLTPDDHDNSVDLFLWKDSAPTELTRVSKGLTGNDGNRDDCNLGWVENCDVQTITDAPKLQGNGNETGNGVTDSPVAGLNGDVYFISPEQLDGARGSFGEANLYHFADGVLRFVTTLEPCAGCSPGRITRFQVAPDGNTAGFVTSSRVTTYDNQGRPMMYLYTPDENRVDCASCRPNGTPPTADTWASQNGLFLTDDGRAFFSTNDAVVVQDTNGANDVYEFVEGKAQLITSGIGPNFEGFAGFQGSQNGPGLVSVSADGVDVFFATYERLVTQDHNGQEIKIYDARSGGGFPAERPKVECEAADECHGAGSSPPALPADRTSVPLEGNQKQTAKAKKCKKTNKKCKKKKRGKRAHRGGRRG